MSAHASMANPVSVAEVEKARDAWIAAVASGSVADTVACYHPDKGKLLGTVDLGDARTGKAKITEYHEKFVGGNDKVVPKFPTSIAEDELQQFGNGVVAYSGYYQFTLTKDGVDKEANAKFTYIWERGADGELKIILHNSGLTPAGVVTR